MDKKPKKAALNKTATSGFLEDENKAVGSQTPLPQPSTSRAPPRPQMHIPRRYDVARSSATPKEYSNFLKWARSKAEELDPDEHSRLLYWAHYTAVMAISPPPEFDNNFLNFAHSKSRMATPEPNKRLFKWPIAANDGKRWSLQEEILKPFETALKCIKEEVKLNASAMKDSFPYPKEPDLKQEHIIYACHYGLYQCQNALWIWPKLAYGPVIPSCQMERGPRYIGENIKSKFSKSDMIEGRPSINKFGFVTIRLSGKWIAKSIQKMLKDGIDTWAPKLPVERVIVQCPRPLNENIHHMDLFGRRVIGSTLIRILEYSKVDVTNCIDDMDVVGITYPSYSKMDDMYDRLFSNVQKEGNLVKKGKRPFIFAKRDFYNAFQDLSALWDGLNVQKTDWIVYVTPVRQQEYIETCFTVAKLGNWESDRHKFPRISYAGYRGACPTEVEYIFLQRFEARCEAGEACEAGMFLGYSSKAIVDCVLTYTFLKNPRLGMWTFDIHEMLNEEGNTFVYLLDTRAKICRITKDSREHINELKEASELILEKDEALEKVEKRLLGLHLLEFTRALEESCLCVLPHILCEYLYDLSKKFNNYYSSCLCKVGSLAETSTLLLCEATAMVMDKCFDLLGIAPTSSFVELTTTQLPFLFSSPELPRNVNARDPPRNSRFELFSFCAVVSTHLGSKEGKLFGLISVSDKYGLLSDGGSDFFEPDFAHVPLFNHDWRNSINMVDWGLVYLANPSSRHSIPFSSSIEIRMELYVTKRKACYQLCNHKKEIDLSNFLDKKSDGECGVLSVEVDDGTTELYYTLLRDAVDTYLEIEFKKMPRGRKVRGYVLAYYGDDFLTECQCPPSRKYCHMALLFKPDPRDVLKSGKIQLIKSALPVPTKGSLVFKAYLEDVESEKVIMKTSCKLKSQLKGSSDGTIRGIEGEELVVKVHWKYDA